MAPNDPPADTSTDTPVDAFARRLREWMAALIALIVVAGTIVLTVAAFFSIGDNDAFSRAKDLLLFINPVLGVVIGFYFNKVSTEARAENAEKTARVASESAQLAVQDQVRTATQAVQATQQAQEVMQQATGQVAQAEQARQEATQQAAQAVSLLSVVSESAQAVLSQPAPAGGVLGAGGGVQPEAADPARTRLEAALEQVRRSGLLSK